MSTHSNLPESWHYIEKSNERLQVLHHCYTYGVDKILHLVGDTQGILSGVMFQIDSALLELYGKLLSPLYDLALKVYYESSVLVNIEKIVKERIEEGIRVHKRQLVNFTSVKQRHMLWHKLTSTSFLPLFPCKHILTILCTYWNNVKYVGDQITQMLWKRKFNTPRKTPQVCVTMKLTFYLPHYQIHRLFQLEAVKDISLLKSLAHYQKRVGKQTTLYDSMKDTCRIIDDMIKDSSTVIQTESIIAERRTSHRLQHPVAI